MFFNCAFLYILLFVEVLLLLTIWKKFNGVLFSPAIYTVGVLTVSTLLNIYCIDYWDITFYPKTFLVIALGLFSLVFAESQAQKRYAGKMQNCNQTIKYIALPKAIVISLSVASVIATYLYFNEIKNIAIIYSMSTGEAIGNVKEFFEEYEKNFNPFVRQGYKVVMGIAYCFTYIFINNCIIYKDKFIKSFWLILPLISSMIVNLISGSRGDMIRMLLLFLFLYYIQVWQHKGWKIKPNRVIMKVALPLIMVALTVFYAGRLFVKANVETQEQMGGPVEYLAYYIGSPIQVLNLHINVIESTPNANSDASIGVATFPGLYSLLKNFRIVNERDIVSPKVGHGMIYVGGDSNAAGNVETIFAPSWKDFGLLGMMIYIYVIYYILSRFFYRNILYEPFSHKSVKKLIVFSFFYYIVELSFYDDCQKWLLCQTGILQLIVILMFLKFVLKPKYFVDRPCPEN